LSMTCGPVVQQANHRISAGASFRQDLSGVGHD
jgi:hypothetical protein